MPRRREVPKREILPDPKFGNVELSKFMNVIMEGGKKAVAERIIYGALEQIASPRELMSRPASDFVVELLSKLRMQVDAVHGLLNGGETRPC